MESVGTLSPTWRLVLVPGLISLGVSLLRLAGELRHWSKPLVNPDVCGKAILGITWLVPVFGAYFAFRLLREGRGPKRLGMAVGLAALGLALKLCGTWVMESGLRYPERLSLNFALSLFGLLLPAIAWPALCKTLFAYGYTARVPVAIIQLLAMKGKWGTHYDALDPGFPPIGFWPTYLRVSFVPGIFFMEAYTAIVGVVFAAVVLAVAVRTGWASGSSRMPLNEKAKQ